MRRAGAPRDVFAQQLERPHGGVECLAVFELRGVRQHELLEHGCLVERQLGTLEQRFGQPLGLLEAAAQIHGLDVAHAELVAELRVADVAYEIEAGDEMAKGGLVGVGVLGLLAGAQVQSGELGLLLGCGGPRRREIEVAHDLEQPLLALLWRRSRHDQPADMVVQVWPFGWRDHGVGRLLQAVVYEAVGDGVAMSLPTTPRTCSSRRSGR